MTRLCLVAAAFVLVLASAASAQNPMINLQQSLSGFTLPIYITHAHDGTNRCFVVEQGGRILVAQPGSVTTSEFMNIQSRVLSGGEQGLLGLAFHPQYSANGRFFVNYTRKPDGATVVSEFHVSPIDSNKGNPLSEIVILTIAQPYANHNGGMIEFGTDGYLYIGMGDGGSGNDPQNHAQNINDLLGKMLRIDIDNPQSETVPFSSPSTNPFYGATDGRDEIFAVGLRNPWRFSFDRMNADLWVGDVGQDALEEIDILTLGGNYGWRVYEGTQCTTLDPCGGSNYTFPIAEYPHSNGRCSIIGGYVYRGPDKSLPAGAYVFGDLCTGEIMMLKDGVQTVLMDMNATVVSFGEDESGEIYIVTYEGIIYHIKRKFFSQVISI